MLGMAKKKPAAEPKRYPSRDKVRYVAIPMQMHKALKGLGRKDDRSVSYMARKAIMAFLEEAGQWPPTAEILALAEQDDEDE